MCKDKTRKCLFFAFLFSALLDNMVLEILKIRMIDCKVCEEEALWHVMRAAHWIQYNTKRYNTIKCQMRTKVLGTRMHGTPKARGENARDENVGDEGARGPNTQRPNARNENKWCGNVGVRT